MDDALNGAAPDKEADLRGAVNPHPMTLLRIALGDLGDGQVLRARTDHKPSVHELIPRFCELRGYPFAIAPGAGDWAVTIRKVEKGIQPILRLVDVHKHFPGRNASPHGVEAVHGVSFLVHEGEFVCLVGSSGCGKSTVLNILAGLEQASRGEVLVHGRPVAGAGTDRVMIFQEPALFPWLTVRENVEFGLRMRRVAADDRRQAAIEQLETVHIEPKFHDVYIHELSGGMKQRVALARALVMDPEVLLMDEPFSALDEGTRKMLQEEIQDVWEKTRKTVVFVTHNLLEAVLLGERVIVMTPHPGRIRREFTIDFPRPRRPEDPRVRERANQILKELNIRGDELAP